MAYPTKDALSKTDLDDNQKVSLFDQDDLTNTRVFFVPLNPNPVDEARSELRIYIRRFKPDNLYLTNVELSIQVICSNSVWRMDDGRQRPLVMIQEILKQLNGADIQFVGLLTFEKSDIRIIQYNQYYTGYELIPQTRST